MAKKIKGTIAILTGGGDVPGLNPAIRAITIRARREGYKVIGLRRGWAGIVEMVQDPKYDNSNNFVELTQTIVNRAGRTESKQLIDVCTFFILARDPYLYVQT